MKTQPFHDGKSITKGNLAMSIVAVVENVLVSVPALISTLSTMF